MKQYIFLFRRFSILLVLYFICRLTFYFIYHKYFSTSSFTEIIFAFVHGVRFDISAIVYSNMLFLFLHLIPWNLFFKKWYQAILKILFYLFNIPALFLNCLDFAYFRFPLKRTTFDLFNTIILGDDVKNTLPKMFQDFWYVIVALILLVVTAEFLYRKSSKEVDESKFVPFFKKNIVLKISASLLVISLLIIGARGGLQLRPLGLMHAASNSPENSQLILNTAFSVIITFDKNSVSESKYFSEEEVKQNFSLKRNYGNEDNFRQLNVVLIILENFSKEYIGGLNNYKGYTPFLDSLMKESLVYTDAYANGKRSIEGIPCIVSSIPALMNGAFITSAYAGNSFSSLASELKKMNYETSFFHGGTNGTMGFDNFTKAAGFDEYYGRTEYNNDTDYDGSWGIYDDAFLKYFADKIEALKKPFFSCVFTISSHHPFTIPEKFKNKFPKGTMPVHESIGYTDFALKQFFESVSSKNWFDSTLFIITADHTGPSEYPKYMSNLGKFSVPVIYYLRNSNLIGESSVTTQQTDIFPTVLDMLNYKNDFYSFGESALDSGSSHFAVNYFNDLYQIISDGYMLSFADRNKIGLYNYKTDSLLQKNLIGENHVREEPLERKLKAIIQTYNAAMLHNKLIER